VDENLVVGLPRIEGWWQPLCHKAVAFDTASAGIIASNDNLPCEKMVTEPDLVLRKEPVGIMGDIEVSVCAAWVR
jgi:hypothetical protein